MLIEYLIQPCIEIYTIEQRLWSTIHQRLTLKITYNIMLQLEMVQ